MNTINKLVGLLSLSLFLMVAGCQSDSDYKQARETVDVENTFMFTLVMLKVENLSKTTVEDVQYALDKEPLLLNDKVDMNSKLPFVALGETTLISGLYAGAPYGLTLPLKFHEKRNVTINGFDVEEKSVLKVLISGQKVDNEFVKVNVKYEYIQDQFNYENLSGNTQHINKEITYNNKKSSPKVIFKLPKRTGQLDNTEYYLVIYRDAQY